MRNLPPIGWILGLFIIFAVVILAYSRSGADPVPSPHSVWSVVQTVKEDIRFRRMDVKVGARKEFASVPFLLQLKRLSDLPGEEGWARYLLQVRPTAPLKRVTTSWLEHGFDLGIVDLSPRNSVGSVQFVAFRKLKEAPTEERGGL